MDVNEEHPSNAWGPIDSTEDGMVIDVRLLQPEKANTPVDVRFDVIFTVFKLLHPLNVWSLIEVTADGIVMDVNEEHPSNALGPIDSTEDGMVTVARFLQL